MYNKGDIIYVKATRYWRHLLKPGKIYKTVVIDTQGTQPGTVTISSRRFNPSTKTAGVWTFGNVRAKGYNNCFENVSNPELLITINKYGGEENIPWLP